MIPFPFGTGGRGALSTGGGGGSGGITPSFTVSRSSVTIPATVFFDAGGTTTTNTDATNSAYGDIYRQLDYSWDFGESGQGSWPVSGIDKNTDIGPVAAHTYETTGTKTVTLTVTLGVPWQGGLGSTYQPIVYPVGSLCTNGGNTYVCNTQHSPSASFSTDAAKWTLVQTGLIQSSTTQTVTCSDISAANTICVSPTANYTGAPVGATTQTTMPTAAAASGKKVLLHAGESFAINAPSGSQSCNYGRYGTGANPTITNTVQPSTNGTASCSFSDLDWSTGNVVSAYCNTLLLRCTINAGTANTAFFIGDASNVANGEPSWDATVYFGNSAVSCTFNDSPAHSIYGACGPVGIMGNTFNAGTNHVIRITTFYQMVLSHNSSPNLDPAVQDAWKIHSGSSTNIYPGTNVDNSWTSSRGVIAYNAVGAFASPSYVYISVQPQNTDVPHPQHPGDEGIFDTLIVNNVATNNSGGNGACNTSGRNLIVRTNRTASGAAFDNTAPGAHVPPPGWNGPYFSS